MSRYIWCIWAFHNSEWLKDRSFFANGENSADQEDDPLEPQDEWEAELAAVRRSEST